MMRSLSAGCVSRLLAMLRDDAGVTHVEFVIMCGTLTISAAATGAYLGPIIRPVLQRVIQDVHTAQTMLLSLRALAPVTH